jgi:hypothetical protein
VTFDSPQDLKKNLDIDQTKLFKLFSDRFIPTLMGEAFKQLKKSEESSSSVI